MYKWHYSNVLSKLKQPLLHVTNALDNGDSRAETLSDLDQLDPADNLFCFYYF